MRLIDDDKLIHALCRDYTTGKKTLGQVIDEQPTAFDVDKVMKQLKQLKMSYFLTIANTGDTDKDCTYKNIANAIDEAIEIVKEGGVE